MEPSPELRALTLRLYQAMASGDITASVQAMAQRPDILSIGTDPDEWWVGYATIKRIGEQQFEQMGGATQGIQVEGSNPQAFVEGTVGWIADRGTYIMPGGFKIPFRMTVVLHQEDGEWKAVQQHVSVGVRNEDLFGHQLATK